MSITGRVISTVAATAFAVAMGAAAYAQQDKDQQGCINAVNKDAAKVGQAQGKENSSCVKTGSKGAVGATCPTDDLKGKVAKKRAKTTTDESSKCGTTPGFAYTSGTNANDAFQNGQLDLLSDMFGGTDLSAIIVADKDTGGCQAAVAKDVGKIAAFAGKAFVKCKKDALKGATVTVTDVQNCVGNDAKGKVAKGSAKLTSDIGKKCGAATQATAFPGACSAAASLGDCLTARAKCRVCLAANDADALSASCDTIDDGMGNSSCGAPAGCPLAAGRYTITNGSGGTLQVASIGPFPFPSGGTVVQDVSAASLPDCVHTTTIPFPGGFDAPQFCIPVLNFNVIVAQTGCGVGRIDSNGGSDFTVHEIGDTSAPSAPCALPDPDCNPGMPPDDNNLRVDVTVGGNGPDTCAGGTTANAISVIPVQTTTWTNPPLTCPDPDGQYDPGTDTLITQFPQVLDFTTDDNKAEWQDIDVDGCAISGSGPAAGFTATGVCIDNAFTTITTAAAGAVASKAAPLHDLTFKTVLPSTISGPTAGSSSCASPPAINFAGTATRCISAP